MTWIEIFRGSYLLLYLLSFFLIFQARSMSNSGNFVTDFFVTSAGCVVVAALWTLVASPLIGLLGFVLKLFYPSQRPQTVVRLGARLRGAETVWVPAGTLTSSQADALGKVLAKGGMNVHVRALEQALQGHVIERITSTHGIRMVRVELIDGTKSTRRFYFAEQDAGGALKPPKTEATSTEPERTEVSAVDLKEPPAGELAPDVARRDAHNLPVTSTPHGRDVTTADLSPTTSVVPSTGLNPLVILMGGFLLLMCILAMVFHGR